jgi:hypothetical protein
MNTDPQRPLTPEEERKAKKALTILYIAMGIMAAVPFLVLWWANRNK